MTADEWKRVETELQGSWGSAKLLVDGYELTLKVLQREALRFSIFVYVNGWFRGEWIVKDCEERRRFFRPSKYSAYTPAMRRALAKMAKRTLKVANIDPDKKLTYYSHYWNSFAPLKRHLVANNQMIELKELGVTSAALLSVSGLEERPS